jgi:hypothetical protein
MNAPTFQVFSYSVRDLNVIVAKSTGSNELAGELTWSDNTGLVEGLDINPEHRLAGIADVLWAEAHKYARDNDLTHPRR